MEMFCVSLCVFVCVCVSYSVVIGFKNILVGACVLVNFNRNNCNTEKKISKNLLLH